MNTEKKNKLWRNAIRHVHYLPHDVRVQMIQAGIQTWGPAPDDLRDELVLLLDEKTPARTDP